MLDSVYSERKEELATGPAKRIAPFSHGRSLVWLIVLIGANMALSAWQPPIGIPEPPFGITTSHTMYADPSYTYDYGSGPEPYRIGPDGPYTHYINPDHPNATNTDNPHGTHTTPRLTWPANLDNLPAGSVVEIHGSGYGSDTLLGSGTLALPVFIRGVRGDEPVHNSLGGFFLRGSYYVFENIKFDMNQGDNTRFMMGYDGDPITHIAVRNCEFFNGLSVPVSSYQVIRSRLRNSHSDLVQNLVFYHNSFHDIGEQRERAVKGDVVAVSIDANTKYVWIVDNTFYNIGGDGIQIAWDSYATSTDMPRYVYVGRNEAHDMFENFLDLKMCQDVIVSQNSTYNIGEGHSALFGGTSIAYRYGLGEGPDDVPRRNIWTLLNVAYNVNSDTGAFSSFTGAGETRADEVYYIGNIAYNCTNSDGTSTGFGSSGQEKVYWLNNTAHNCDRGGFFIGDNVGDISTEKLTLVNNIFGDIPPTSTLVPYNLMIGGVQESLDRMVIKNNLYYDNGGDAKFRVGIYAPPAHADWTTYSTYAEFRHAYPTFCTNSVEADPQFVDAANGDFHLTSSSVANGGGVLSSAYQRFFDLYGIDITKDIEGASRPQPAATDWDIGAYESSSIPPTRHDLTVSSSNGGSVINPGETAYRYLDGTLVPIVATASTNYQFTGWTGSAVDAGKVANAGAASTTLTTDADYILVANFSLIQRTLTISSSSGGSVTTPGEGALPYDHGSAVPLVATPSANYTFENWTGAAVSAGKVADADAANTTVTANADYTLVANFSPVQRTLTISSGSGGSVTTPGEGAVAYSHGSSVSIVATPSTDYAFVNWTGTAVSAGKVADADAVSTTVTADGDYTIVANFRSTGSQRTLTISSNAGGTVATPGEGDLQYTAGDSVSVLATPTTNHVFVNWTGTAVSAGQVTDPDAAGTTVTVDGDHTLFANFTIDSTPPTVTNLSPDADDVQIARNALILLDIVDTGKGVDADSVNIQVNGEIVYTGNADSHSSTNGVCRRSGNKAAYQYVYQGSNAFGFDQTLEIAVNATDLAANAMSEYTYSFTSEMRSFGEKKTLRNLTDGRRIIGSPANQDEENPLTLASDSSGNVWAAWTEGDQHLNGNLTNRDIYLGKIIPGSDGFESGDILQVTDDEFDQANPVLAIDASDTLYLVWQDQRLGNWDLYVSTSTDGINFSSASRITDPNYNQTNPAVAIDSSNTLRIVYEDDQNVDTDIYLTSSADGYAAKTRVCSAPYDQTTPDIAVDSADTVYVVWTDQRNSRWTGGASPEFQAHYDIYGAASPAWTDVEIVDITKGSHQAAPKIVTESTGTVLHLVWLDNETGDYDVYYGSADGLPATPLEGVSVVDSGLPAAVDQKRPALTVTGHVGGTGNSALKGVVCWEDGRYSDIENIHAVEATDPGTNIWVGDDDTGAVQNAPAIAMDQYNEPFLAWVSDKVGVVYSGSAVEDPVPLVSPTLVSASTDTTVGTPTVSIVDEDDVSVMIPAGALPSDLEVTIARVRNPHKFPTDNHTPLYEFGPSGITFSDPVTITIPFQAPSLVSSPSAYWYDPLTGQYRQTGITDVEVITISSGLYALRFKTSHFTAFCGVALSGTDSGGGSNGGCSLSPCAQGTMLESLLPYISLAAMMTALNLRDRRNRHAQGHR